MQKSIEVEYWVIDDEGALTAPGALVEHSQYVEEEFVDCLFELKTPPCESMDELRTTFAGQLSDLIERADELDRQLVPLGTPLANETIEFLEDDRSEIQKAVLGSNFEYAKHCAGTHVHFEQRNVIDQLNTLIALDPALALCNSSPYFQGDRIADGARAYLYRKKCYQEYPKHGQLWEYAETVAQWTRRLDRRYSEFTEIAAEQGISAERVDAHFSPDDVVWTPVRLRDEMPTVEWRSPDATLPSQILLLVESVEAIMDELHGKTVTIGGESGRVTADEVILPEFDVVCDYAETAMHDGITADRLADYLTRMEFSVSEHAPLTREFADLGHLSTADARTLRLQYANRLAEDVDRLTTPA